MHLQQSGQSQFPDLESTSTGHAHPSSSPAQPLSMPPQLPLTSSPSPELQRPVTSHSNSLRSVRLGEQRQQLTLPPSLPTLLPPPPPPPPPLRLPLPPPHQTSNQCQPHQQLPVAFHPTIPQSLPNPTQPPQQPHSDVLDPTNVGTIPDPLDDCHAPMGNLRAAMGLDKTSRHRAYYCVIRVGILPGSLCNLTHSCSSVLFIVEW